MSLLETTKGKRILAIQVHKHIQSHVTIHYIIHFEEGGEKRHHRRSTKSHTV